MKMHKEMIFGRNKSVLRHLCSRCDSFTLKLQGYTVEKNPALCSKLEMCRTSNRYILRRELKD